MKVEVLGSYAVTHAPTDATRAALVDGIGRGIGRAAAHELAHQLLTRDFHQSTDRESYDYRSVNRVAQFYGPIHWDIAGPWLRERLGDRE